MRAKLRTALIVLLAGAPTTAWSQSGLVPSAEILRVVREYPALIRSARVEGVETDSTTEAFSRTTHGEVRPHTEKRQVVWAFKGEKLYRQSVEHFDPKADGNRKYRLVARTYTRIFDGRRGYLLIAHRHTGRSRDLVQTTVSSRPMTDVPIQYMGYKIFGVWVGDMLRSGRCRLDGTEADATFGVLYRFSVDRKPGLLSRVTGKEGVDELIRFWLAPRYGFLAVRSSSEHGGVREPQRLVYRVARAERRGAIWFPVKGSREAYAIEGNREALLTSDQITVNRFELNTVPDSLFRASLETGDYVKDDDTNTMWRIGTGGKWIYSPPHRTLGIGEMPIGWLFMASLTGSLALAAGAFLRWRRRPAS